MLKILLVDDETLVRANIRMMLMPCSADFFICGEASSGQQALALAAELKPDVVITDMKMKEMTGVELCRALHQAYPQLILIALSNYDDYLYVRGALKNGAVDYILKHNLNTDTITQVLRDVQNNLGERHPVEDETTGNILALRRKFLINLINGLYSSKEEIISQIAMLNLKLKPDNLIPITVAVDHYLQAMETDSLKKRTILEFAIINVVEEALSQFSNGAITHVSDEYYCILLSFDGVPSVSFIENQINTIVHKISTTLSTYLNLSVSFSIGSICKSPDLLSKSYEDSKRALTSRFYSGDHSILKSGDILKETKFLTGLDIAQEKQLFAALRRKEEEQILRILNDLFDTITTQKLSISNAQMVFMDLISVINSSCRENEITLNHIYPPDIQPGDIMRKLSTIYEIKEWFVTSFKRLCVQLNKQTVQSDSYYVKQAIIYIHKNFSKDISQQDIAEKVGISSGYLSTVFRIETGSKFSDYLSDLRISEARLKLESGENDLHEIAEACGFRDYSYFFRVFKKKTKLTPKEYEKMLAQ